MNGEFIQGRIKLNPERCSQLADKYAGLIWDERAAKRGEHRNCPKHLTDATLYAWRFCYSYLSEGSPPRPMPGTTEWYEARSERDGGGRGAPRLGPTGAAARGGGVGIRLGGCL